MQTEAISLKHLFQQEFTRLVALLSRRFSLAHIELAEDIVSETFLLAAETWGVRGLPTNPTGWLYAVARQKMLYHLRQQKTLTRRVLPELVNQPDTVEPADNWDVSETAIRDSQLQMLFAVCTPLLADEAQIGLALRILCGFGIDEIAEAFLTNKATIHKRLYRAKEKLRSARVTLTMPSANQLTARLDRVLHVVYLLFNEGYYSKTQNQTLQKDLCLEAMRLGVMLTEDERTDQPRTNALLALMCFHASRFDARRGDGEPPVLYEQQNVALWNTALVRRGMYYLERSLRGNQISRYHLEARIASWHCVKADSNEKWAAILHLYDQLRAINDSPAVALNRLYALYQVSGWQVALAEAERLDLKGNHLYYVLLGELYGEADSHRAMANYQQAYALARTVTEQELIQQKIAALDPAS